MSTFTTSGCMLLLTIAAWLLLQRHHHSASSCTHARHNALYGVYLLVVVFCGSAILFVVLAIPNKTTDARRLSPQLASLPMTTFTDTITARELRYLSAFRTHPRVSVTSFFGSDLVAILHKRSGCLLISEPQLHELQSNRNLISGRSFGLLEKPPAGWFPWEMRPSAQTPFEHVGIICPQRAPK
jgi:hypothetical protein